jgi:hypothetical protein
MAIGASPPSLLQFEAGLDYLSRILQLWLSNPRDRRSYCAAYEANWIYRHYSIVFPQELRSKNLARARHRGFYLCAIKKICTCLQAIKKFELSHVPLVWTYLPSITLVEDKDAFPEEVWGPFTGGTRSPVGPWIHGNVKSRPLIRTDLEQRRRLNLGGGEKPT